MIPDQAFILATFRKFDDLCFGGSLPCVPVVLTKARTFVGKICYRGRRTLLGRTLKAKDFQMRISVLFDLPEQEWEDVVIHEMIHLSIALRGIRDTSSHGKVFRETMDSINTRYGRHITVRHKGEAPRPQAPRLNYICVSRFEDGRWGVTSCTQDKVPVLQRTLPRYYRLSSMAWYTSTDPFFNRFPRSRTPKIYKITLEELEAHLPGITEIAERSPQ